jgi:dethiobiotin synthetase
MEMARTIFITGTDTGVGKTVLTALLVRFLRMRGVHAAALKPICSGGRDDARKIFAAMNGTLTLDEINPWHFRAAVAPALAAKLEKKSVKLLDMVAHIRATRKIFDVVLVEGAGGLLSPLGEKFDSRDLIVALRATPIIVAQNKLGAVNHLLLTLEALPKNLRAKTKVVLISPPKSDTATATNAKLLSRFFPAEKIFTLPWLGENFAPAHVLKSPQIRRTLRALAAL